MRQMNVLLVAPSTGNTITDTRWVTAPLGIHYIASYLNKHGHNARVWDINIDNESLEDVLNSLPWDVVGFSTLEATLEYDIVNIRLASKLCTMAILVAGGTGATLNYQTYFNQSPLHCVIQAEGERPMLQLCNMLADKGWNESPIHTIRGLIIRNYADTLSSDEYWNIRKDLDVKAMQADKYWRKTASLYQHPNFDEVNTFRLYTSNYCPMGCAFCTLSRLRKYSCGKHTKVVWLTAKQIVELINSVLEEYKDCRQIFFVDDDFFISPSRTVEFCTLVIKLKKEGKLPDYLQFICLTSVIRITEGNIKLIKEAGFRVLSIGVESTSQFVLDSLDKKQTVEQIWNTTHLILDNGIKPYYTLILFSPDGRVSDLITDLYGFRKLSAMGVGLSIEPYFIPLKGTRLSEEGSPERVRKVALDGDDYIYKSFAWLPKKEEVQPVFKRFEVIYPKYRKWRFDQNVNAHKEKNFQAHVILDALEEVLYEFNYIDKIDDNNLLAKNLYYIDSMESYNVDIIGNITK